MMVMMIVMVMVMVMIMMMMLLVFVMVMVMVMVMVLIIKVASMIMALMMFDINDILRQSLTHLFCFNLSRKCRETGVFRYPCLYRSRKRNGEFH